jgi:hypothetical protein
MAVHSLALFGMLLPLGQKVTVACTYLTARFPVYPLAYMICDSLFHNIYTEDKNFLEYFAYFTERSRLGTYGKSKKVPLAPVVLDSDSEPNPDNIAYFSYDPLPSDQKRNNSSHSIPPTPTPVRKLVSPY